MFSQANLESKRAIGIIAMSVLMFDVTLHAAPGALVAGVLWPGHGDVDRRAVSIVVTLVTTVVAASQARWVTESPSRHRGEVVAAQ